MSITYVQNSKQIDCIVYLRTNNTNRTVIRSPNDVEAILNITTTVSEINNIYF